MDVEKWKFINTFAPWFSAFGTFAAVTVSLYLTRKERIRLALEAGRRAVGSLGQEGKFLTYLQIYIVNTGRREATITSIHWQFGLFRKVRAVQFPPNNAISSSLPRKLQDGEEARYLFPLEGETLWLEDFAREFLLPNAKRSLRHAKVGVFTSTGNVFWVRISRSLQEWLANYCGELLAKTSRVAEPDEQ